MWIPPGSMKHELHEHDLDWNTSSDSFIQFADVDMSCSGGKPTDPASRELVSVGVDDPLFSSSLSDESWTKSFEW